MTPRRKVTILSVFFVGLVSVTVAILRLPALISVTSVKTDASVDVEKMSIVPSFEVQCAIIAVNIPALKLIWTRFRGKHSSAASEDFSLQRRYNCSGSASRGLGADSKKGSSTGFITKLEGN